MMDKICFLRDTCTKTLNYAFESKHPFRFSHQNRSHCKRITLCSTNNGLNSTLLEKSNSKRPEEPIFHRTNLTSLIVRNYIKTADMNYHSFRWRYLNLSLKPFLAGLS